ncbi:hypothetical protein T4D_10424 [Trichinella pseudospiralis]|uniref:Uncharacterized protein n=1 Tax=Trichinella pseudospiralis TaxID=6337 RepID=A0A0V1F972_TRIPS|nr:hypothetical protein T4D_10424 [Trichinella pseudospiralis]
MLANLTPRLVAHIPACYVNVIDRNMRERVVEIACIETSVLYYCIMFVSTRRIVHHEQREQREQLEAKLRKEPAKKREYENTLKEYIDNGQSLKRSGT